jgi:CHAT domain-containing protein/Tfp pilus assembly protein PilF
MRTNKILSVLLIIMICPQLSFAQDITADTTLANSYFEIAGIFKDSTQYDSAIVYFEKASLLYEKHELWRKYLQSETHHGFCYQELWQQDNSIATIKSAIKIALIHISENDTIVADAYYNLGFPYFYKSMLDTTIFYWEKSLQIKKDIYGEESTYVAADYNNIGIVYRNKNEFVIALKYLLTSLQIRKILYGEKHTDVASSYMNIGNVYKDINEFDLALENFNKALQIDIGVLGKTNPVLAMRYHSIGTIYWNKNEFDLALEYFFKAMQIYKDQNGQKHIGLADSYHAIGIVYTTKNDYEMALEYYLKALQEYMDLLGEKNISVADCYNNIGNVYDDIKEYDLSLKYYNNALQIYKELLGEKHLALATSYMNIGNIYADIKEYDLSLKYYYKSIQIIKDILNNEDPMPYNNIGSVFYERKEYDLALRYYQKAITSSLRNFNDTINIYSVPIIKDYLNWDELLKALQEKATIFADTSIALPKVKTLAKLGLSLRHYQACDTLISQVRKEIRTKSDKIALGEKASEIYKGAVNVCLKSSDSAKPDSVSYYKNLAFYFSEKNKSSVLLEALAGAEAQKFAGIPDTLLDKEHKLQVDIVLYKKVLSEQPDSAKEILFRDKLFKANRQYDELITVFEGRYPEYFELKYNRKPTSIKEIQKILDNKTAIISYFTGDSIITIFTITKKNLDVKTVPAIENLADTIRDFRNGLIYTSSSRFAKVYKKYACKMYRQLIPENVDKKITNLIIIPDAELSMIPFETLLTENPEDKEWNELPYLIRKYNISYSYSANLFYKTFSKEPSTKIEFTGLNDWIAFAPVFDDSNTAGLTMRTRELIQKFDKELNDTTETRGMLVKGGYVSPLPGTESEVKSIFKQFDEKGKKALVQINNNANEGFIKSGELKKYRLLHFATHGFVNTRKPELSGIFLAQDSTIDEDGILYSGEIYNLELNADLTVLSACETGLGEIKKGEGLIGLTRALLYAGSKNIIVSLWKVADESTSGLMIDFYKNLLKEEQEKQEFSHALQQAKLKMIDEGKYAHPFYWSPFILIGK